MGLHGIAQLIYTLDGGVGSGIKADAVVGAADVVINGAGNANHVDAIFTQRAGPTESTIATDGNNAIQTKEFAGGNSSALTVFGHEFLTAGGVENRAAAVDGVRYAFFVQADNIAGNQAVPATPNAIALNPMVDGSTNDGAHTGIHAGGVTAAGEHANSFYAHDVCLLVHILDRTILQDTAQKVKRI